MKCWQYNQPMRYRRPQWYRRLHQLWRRRPARYIAR